MMRADVSDIKKCKEEIKGEVQDFLSELARKGVEYAKEYGDYQNQTHNLRNAIGAAVIMDGEIKDVYIPAKGGHEEARDKTKETINESRLRNGIVIADGMEYASFVESKGYDVISGGALHIEKEGQASSTKNK